MQTQRLNRKCAVKQNVEAERGPEFVVGVK